MICKVTNRRGSVRRMGYMAHMERVREDETSLHHRAKLAGDAFIIGTVDPRNPDGTMWQTSKLRAHFARRGVELGGTENDHIVIGYADTDVAKLREHPELMRESVLGVIKATGYNPEDHDWYACWDEDHIHIGILRRDCNGVLQGQGRFAENQKAFCRGFEKEHGLAMIHEHPFRQHGHKHSKPERELGHDLADAVNSLDRSASAEALSAALAQRGLWMTASYDNEGHFHGWRAGREDDPEGETASKLGFVGKGIACPKLNAMLPALDALGGDHGGILLLGPVPEQQRERAAGRELSREPTPEPEPEPEPKPTHYRSRGGSVRKRDLPEMGGP